MYGVKKRAKKGIFRYIANFRQAGQIAHKLKKLQIGFLLHRWQSKYSRKIKNEMLLPYETIATVETKQ